MRRAQIPADDVSRLRDLSRCQWRSEVREDSSANEGTWRPSWRVRSRVLAPGGVCCFLECKADSGKLSPEQTWFKSELIKMGFAYAVIRNLDDLRTFILQNRIPNRIAEQAARMVAA
jgi:hypothetical protein